MPLLPECSGVGEGLKENTSREYPAYTTVFKYRGFLFQSAKETVSQEHYLLRVVAPAR